MAKAASFAGYATGTKQEARPVRLTINDLAKRWGVSRRTIERRIEDGVIPKPLMLGGRSWFLAAIEQFEQNAGS